jgi:hypothetical protein
MGSQDADPACRAVAHAVEAVVAPPVRREFLRAVIDFGSEMLDPNSRAWQAEGWDPDTVLLNPSCIQEPPPRISIGAASDFIADAGKNQERKQSPDRTVRMVGGMYRSRRHDNSAAE